MRHKNRVTPIKGNPSSTQTEKTFLSRSSEGSLLADDSMGPTSYSTRPYSAPGMPKNEEPVTGIVLTDEGDIEGIVEIHDNYTGEHLEGYNNYDRYNATTFHSSSTCL